MRCKLTMLGSNVQRHCKGWALACNARDMHDALRIAGAGFARLGCRRWIQPSRDCQLGGANRMGEVDVQAGVMAYSIITMDLVFRFFRPRGMPKVSPVWFEYASAWAHLSLSTNWTKTVIDVEADIRYLRLRTLSQRHRTCC